MTTDDFKDLVHVVIVETESGIRIIEFERGLMEQAHAEAMKIASQEGFFGRVIVCIRARQLQPHSYAKKHNTL